jgi:hypothetical protein
MMYFGIARQRSSIAMKYIGNEKIGGSIHGGGDFTQFVLGRFCIH